MAGFSSYLEGKIIATLFQGAAFISPPAKVYLALFINGTELTAATSTGYARVEIAPAAWGVPVVGLDGTRISNTAALEFPGADADWQGPITGFGLYDSVLLGNLLFSADLASPRSVTAGDALRFAPGALTIRID